MINAAMVNGIFLKTLRDMRTALLWSALGLFLMSLYLVTFFPSIEENYATLTEIFERMGPTITALTGGEMDISTVEGFLATKVFSLTYPVILIAFGIAFGAGLVGSEEESGTLDVLLATPVARWRVVLAKFAALVAFVAVVLAATFLGFVAGAKLVDLETMRTGRILAGVINLGPLTLFFAALALALSCWRNARGPALGVPVALAAGSWLIHALAGVSDIPAWLHKLTPWYHYDGQRALLHGPRPGGMLLLLVLAAALVAVAAWSLEHRDVGV